MWKKVFVVRLLALVLTASMLSGCMGLLADSITKSIATGDKYSEMAASIVPPSGNDGRLYIYRTEASTKTGLRYGIGLVKNPTVCTVDDDASELIWETFKYFDLPSGQHQITCGSDVVKSTDFWSGKRHYQRGANKVEISVSSQSETYIRVESVDGVLKPVIVENAQGRAEIAEIAYQKKDKYHTFPPGKVGE